MKKNLTIDKVISLAEEEKNNNNFDSAIDLYNQILKEYPKNFISLYNLGALYLTTKRHKLAKPFFEKVIEIDPNNTEALINLGTILEKEEENLSGKKNYEKIISLYEKVIQINPSHLTANIVLAKILSKFCDRKKAIKIYQKSINLIKKEDKVLLSQIYNAIGSLYAQIGSSHQAIENFSKSSELNSKNELPILNIINTLGYYSPDYKSTNKIVVANNNINKIQGNFILENGIKNSEIANIFNESNKLVKNIAKNILVYNETQIFRRIEKELNCLRHFKIFNKFNVIPKFCFSCFKIVIEPKDIIGLFKLFFIFDKFKFIKNNWRKCMIEMRPKVSGTYKGFIYCSSEKEANEILQAINPILKKYTKYKINIKRGCTEYAQSFPNYKKINNNDGNFMKYNPEWQILEEAIDVENVQNKEYFSANSLSGLSIVDVLIMNNWLNYAKIINDLSYKEISDKFSKSEFIFKNLSNQLEVRKKEFFSQNYD